MNRNIIISRPPNIGFEDFAQIAIENSYLAISDWKVFLFSPDDNQAFWDVDNWRDGKEEAIRFIYDTFNAIHRFYRTFKTLPVSGDIISVGKMRLRLGDRSILDLRQVWYRIEVLEWIS